MIESEHKDVFYLSSSIAATLAASQLSICSLKTTVLFITVALNAEILFGILAARYQYNAFTLAAILMAVFTLIWSVFQMSRALSIERDLRAALSLWSKELADLSGDLVEAQGGYEREREMTDQRIRVIQRFLELLTSAGRSSV